MSDPLNSFRRMPSTIWPHTLSVGLLLLIGAFLRFFALGELPLPAHQDEVSEVYDSYSILTTGADRAGTRHPLVLRGLGDVDYRPALYAWITTIPLKVSGFSIAAGRVPSAFLGVASLLFLFLFARSMAGDKFGLLVLLFGVLSPWHIAFSRLAHEGTMLPPFFIILALWSWHRAAIRGYTTTDCALAGFVVGLSANSYQTMRLIAPLLLLLVLFDVLRNKGARVISGLTLSASAMIGAMPQLIVLATDPNRFFARAGSSLLPTSSPGEFVFGVALNLVQFLSPKLLFWPDMSDSGLTPARLMPVEVLFLYVGLLSLWAVPVIAAKRFWVYTYIVFLVTLLPAALTTSPHSIRASACITLLPIFSAAGTWQIGCWLQKFGLGRQAYYRGVYGAIAASFLFVAYMYLWSPKAPGQRSNNALVQVGQRMRTHQGRYDRVFMTDSASHPDIYIVAFSGMTPAEYQAAEKIIESRDGWDIVKQVGKYRFLSPVEMASQAVASRSGTSRDLFVSRTRLPNMVARGSVGWFEERYYFAGNSLHDR